MKFRFTAAAFLCALTAACGNTSAPQPSSFASRITVGPNVQVSAENPNLFHGEVLIAADPLHAKHLIACSGVWPHTSTEGIRDYAYQTMDGGQTWNQIYSKHVGNVFDLDPVCEIGPDGTMFMGGAAAATPVGHDFVVRSRDGGAHWDAPLILPWGDRDFIAIDKTHSRYRGRVYYTATNAWNAKGTDYSYIGDIFSDNDGGAFSSSVKVTPLSSIPGSTLDLNGGPVAVLASGHVMVLGYKWPSSADSKVIDAFVSTDGGKTFSSGRMVGMRAGTELLSTSTGEKGQGASVLPVIAADTSPGPFKGRVYVAWQDFSNGLQASVMIAHSDDEGLTWSQALQVDDAPAWPARQYPVIFSPSVAVNGHGIVAVGWFDGRGVADGMGGTLRMATSSDGGETFSPSVPVASATSLVVPNVGVQKISSPGGGYGQMSLQDSTRYHVFAGDTQGLVADADGTFHPLWTDNRTGISQLWTATVVAHQTPVRHGDPSLASLKDVTNSVGLAISNAVYDKQNNTVSVDLALVNDGGPLAKRKAESLAGPIYLRAARIVSPIGSAELTTSDNGMHGPGAILAFHLARGQLAPKAQTLARHLVFQLSNVHPITGADTAGDSMTYVTLKYYAYAK